MTFRWPLSVHRSWRGRGRSPFLDGLRACVWRIRSYLRTPRLGGAGCLCQSYSGRKHAWFQRLKLKCDEPLSKFAFNISLRRYAKGLISGFVGDSAGVLDLVPVDAVVSVMLASLPEAAAARGGARVGAKDGAHNGASGGREDVRRETRTTAAAGSAAAGWVGAKEEGSWAGAKGGEGWVEEEVTAVAGTVAAVTVGAAATAAESLDALEANFKGTVGETDGNGVVVYHVATSTLNPLNFAEFLHIVRRHFLSSPLIDRRSGQPIAAEARIQVFPNRYMFELDTWLRQGGIAAALTSLREAVAPGTIPSADRRRGAVTRRKWENLRKMGALYAPYTSYAVGWGRLTI